MSHLPGGWARSTLAEVVGSGLFTDGDWVESKDQDPDGEVRLTQLADVGEGRFRDRSNRRLTSASAIRLKCTFLELGDVLVARMPEPLGRACRVPWLASAAVTVVDVCVLRPLPGGVDTHWLMWALNSPQVRGQIAALESGTTRKRISRTNLASVMVCVPPRAEQERIVAAIEENLSHLDAAGALLRMAEARLRLLRSKTMESLIQDAPLASLGDLTIDSRYGTSVKCSYEASGVGVIRIPNIVGERVDSKDLKYSTVPVGRLTSVLVRDGDVFFVRTNGSRDLIGRAAVASGVSAGLGFASYLIRYRLSDHVDPKYLCAAVSAPSIRRTIEQMAATTAGQYNLSISKLDTVSIPVPALETQRRLVAERATALDAIAHLAGGLDAVRLRGQRLRRSILAAAFSGQLVPQDPTDEPASVLLHRIRAERDAPPKASRARKVTA